MTETDRAVQVPVSLPSREQIAARLRGDIFDAVPDDNDMQHVLSLAADLLSQPTPTAEFLAYNIVNQIADVYYENIPSEKWVAVRQATNDRLWKWTEQMILSTAQPTPTAEPDRIEDMAPGTTFTRADFPDEVWTVKRDICDGGLYALSDGHRSQNAEDIDPSTIRDVTPPAVTE